MTRASRAALLAVWALAAHAHALEGRVYVDADADGVRDPAEAGLAGVVVTNGLELTRSGPEGLWTLREGPDGFVRITCPDDYRCPQRYRQGSGDFGLVPAPAADDFFFVQVSDVHAYDEAADFAAWSSPELPGWLPDPIVNWLLLFQLGRGYPELSREQIAEGFRLQLALHRSVGDLSDAAVIRAYAEEFRRPGSALGRVRERIQQAIAEVAALQPDFVIDTGDLVLEGNRAPADVVERWFRFYDEATRATGIPWISTLGNNEIAGIDNPDFDADDPRFGKHFFRALRGPSWFSFDRGPFHFVALDTHRPDPDAGDPKQWLFTEMPDAERAWLEADLAAHADRVLVALNHEPFVIHPSWPFASDLEPARDAGLFERHRVAYTLTGHVHRNGLARQGVTTHITTGALSGMRWIVPDSVHPRGYRLLYARDGRLFSAWKQLGQPVLGFVVPAGDPEIAPASGVAAGPEASLVAVAADARGPFAEVTLSLDGQPLAVERWGDFFVAARVPGGRLREGARLGLRARSASGRLHKLSTVVAREGEDP